MDVLKLLRDAEDAGVVVTADGDSLKMTALKKHSALVGKLQKHKKEVLSILKGERAPAKQKSSGSLKPRLIRMCDVESKPIKWLWPDRIALGRLSLLVGKAGLGKSYLTIDMAARITRGLDWPDGSPCEQGSVLLMTAEDDPEDTIKPRLDANGADTTKVQILAGQYNDQDSEDAVDLMVSLSDLVVIEEALKSIPDCRLIVVDPIGSYIGGRIDSYKDNDVRSVLAPAAKLCESYGVAMLCIAHRRKSVGGSADDVVLGSRAFTGLARSVWHLVEDTEDAERRLLVSGKNNLGPPKEGLAYRIVGRPGVVKWDEDPVKMTADEAFVKERAAGSDESMSAIEEAQAWLLDRLADGPRHGRELKSEGKSDGISERTLDRAAGKLGVVKGPNGLRGPWVWRLPDADCVGSPVSPKSSQSRQAENDGESTDSVARVGDSNGRAKVRV